jgi:nucleoside-diphosphate-sugar epimerase
MKILVTGASGFIGGHFASDALSRGHEVHVSARRPDSVSMLEDAGARFWPGDLRNEDDVAAMSAGVDVIVHCAGAVGDSGPYRAFEEANVDVTRGVVAGARRARVPVLVQLSSPSISYTSRGRLDIPDGDVPAERLDAYSDTKYRAEQLALDSRSSTLSVIALRPSVVIGPGDRGVMFRVIQQQIAGRLKQVGNGRNLIDLTSMDNALAALWAAIDAAPGHSGSTYNITNGAPVRLWDEIRFVFDRLGLGAVHGRIPYALALAAGRVLLRTGAPDPRITPLAAAILGASRTLDIGGARRDLGYRPSPEIRPALTEFCDWVAPLLVPRT